MSKVLIIDDSAVMRKIIKKNIQESGLLVDEFVEAETGIDGLKEVITNNIDLILYEWGMLNMSGVDFVEVLRKLGQKSNIPIIMMATEGSETEVENSGANGCLTKPLTSDRVRLKLGNFLKVK